MILIACAAIGGAIAHADPDHAPGRVYQPAYFARFAPQTALDMVREVPGFDLRAGNGDRGLGQADANVLINGARISSKSSSIFDALSRIPARRVERIELSDAARLNVPGLSGQVLNVIAPGGALSGVWSWQGQLRRRLEPEFGEVSASVSGQRGDLSGTLSLENDPFRRGNNGIEAVTDGAGGLIALRDEDRERTGVRSEITLNLGWTPPSGHVANLELAYALANRTSRERSLRMPLGAGDTLRRLQDGEDEWAAEASGDYAFPLAGGRLKLIGLIAHEDERERTIITRRPLGQQPGAGARSDEDAIENEVIARGEYSISPKPGRDWEAALELAYNRLDAGGRLFDLPAPAPASPAILLQSDIPTQVEERRGEASLTHGRRLGERLSMQVSGGVEYSRLSQSGPSALARTFLRPFGYLASAYEVRSDLDLNLRVERSVGQLDFNDFVSSQDLNNNNPTAGNPQLVPDQTWLFEAELDADLGAAGAARLRVFREHISDIIDRVPIGADGEGPGNLDSARRTGLAVTATIKLDGIGLSGIELDLEGETRSSSLTDPVTGRDRSIRGDLVSRVEADLRWDLADTPWAFTAGYEQERNARRFRLDESSFFRSVPGSAVLRVTHKDLAGATGFFEVANLAGQEDRFTRTLFSPDRSGEIVEQEAFRRDFGQIGRASCRERV